jgi:hypothetical protein
MPAAQVKAAGMAFVRSGFIRTDVLADANIMEWGGLPGTLFAILAIVAALFADALFINFGGGQKTGKWKAMAGSSGKRQPAIASAPAPFMKRLHDFLGGKTAASMI